MLEQRTQGLPKRAIGVDIRKRQRRPSLIFPGTKFIDDMGSGLFMVHVREVRCRENALSTSKEAKIWSLSSLTRL